MSDRKRSGAREQVTNSWRVGVLALLFTGAFRDPVLPAVVRAAGRRTGVARGGRPEHRQ